MAHYQEPSFKRTPRFNYGPYEETVVYSPDTGHWYLDTRTYNRGDSIVTRKGEIKISSLKENKVVNNICSASVKNGFSHDLCFLKDSQGRLGVFTSVVTSDDCGQVYRSDRRGFGYRTANLYFDTWSEWSQEAVAFLATEDLSGRWSLVSIWNPHYYSFKYDVGTCEFLVRHLIISGFNTEKELIEHFIDDLKGPNLLDDRHYFKICSDVNQMGSYILSKYQSLESNYNSIKLAVDSLKQSMDGVKSIRDEISFLKSSKSFFDASFFRNCGIWEEDHPEEFIQGQKLEESLSRLLYDINEIDNRLKKALSPSD